MSPTHQRRPRRSSVAGEEEKAWVQFYKRANDPELSAEILAQINADPEMKRERLALYLRCKESIRKEKARQARNQRIGVSIRRLFVWLFVLPWEALRRTARSSGGIVIEVLPEVERPVRHVLKTANEATQVTQPASADVPTVIRRRKPHQGSLQELPSGTDTDTKTAS